MFAAFSNRVKLFVASAVGIFSFSSNPLSESFSREDLAALRAAKQKIAELNSLKRDDPVFAQIDQAGSDALRIAKELIDRAHKKEAQIDQILLLSHHVAGSDAEYKLRKFLRPSWKSSEAVFTRVIKDAQYAHEIYEHLKKKPAFRELAVKTEHMPPALKIDRQLLDFIWRDGPFQIRENANALKFALENKGLKYSQRLIERLNEGRKKKTSSVTSQDIEDGRKARAASNLLESIAPTEIKPLSTEEQIRELEQILAQIATEQAATEAEHDKISSEIPEARHVRDQEIEQAGVVRELVAVALDEARTLNQAKDSLIGQVRALGGNVSTFENDSRIQNLLKGYDPQAAKDAFETYDKPESKASRHTAHGFNLNPYTSDDPRVKVLLASVETAKANSEQKGIALKLACREIESLYRDKVQAEREKARLTKKLELLSALSDELPAEASQLKFMLKQLKANGSIQKTFSEKAKYPEFSELETWAKANLNGRVVFAKAAFKSAAKSDYRNPEHVYQALELLANEFWEQKMSGGNGHAAETRKAFGEKMDALYLSFGKSITRVDPSLRPKYEVTFEGNKYFLDQHLGRGTSRDPERCLRIYFTWLEEQKQILVGHLPEHLPNSMT